MVNNRYVPSVMASASFALFPDITPLSTSFTFCGTELPAAQSFRMIELIANHIHNIRTSTHAV